MIGKFTAFLALLTSLCHAVVITPQAAARPWLIRFSSPPLAIVTQHLNRIS